MAQQGAGEPVCEFCRERVPSIKVVAERVKVGYVGRFEGRWSSCSCCGVVLEVELMMVLVVLVVVVENVGR